MVSAFLDRTIPSDYNQLMALATGFLVVYYFLPFFPLLLGLVVVLRVILCRNPAACACVGRSYPASDPTGEKRTHHHIAVAMSKTASGCRYATQLGTKNWAPDTRLAPMFRSNSPGLGGGEKRGREGNDSSTITTRASQRYRCCVRRVFCTTIPIPWPITQYLPIQPLLPPSGIGGHPKVKTIIAGETGASARAAPAVVSIVLPGRFCRGGCRGIMAFVRLGGLVRLGRLVNKFGG